MRFINRDGGVEAGAYEDEYGADVSDDRTTNTRELLATLRYMCQCQSVSKQFCNVVFVVSVRPIENGV